MDGWMEFVLGYVHYHTCTSTVCSVECPGGPEEPCSNNGICDEGRNGTGKCECQPLYTGEACQECVTGKTGSNCSIREWYLQLANTLQLKLFAWGGLSHRSSKLSSTSQFFSYTHQKNQYIYSIIFIEHMMIITNEIWRSQEKYVTAAIFWNNLKTENTRSDLLTVTPAFKTVPGSY